MRSSFRTLTLILSEDQSKKFTHIAKEKHLIDGILLIGKGTIRNHILNVFGLKSQKRIVVNTLVEKERTVEILNCITERLKLHEPNHGIAYTTAVNVVKYTDGNQQENRKEPEDTEEDSMFKKLTVIVNRGMADDVMDIARRAGVRGGTILHGRGTGSDCAAKLFGIEIEPEKN